MTSLWGWSRLNFNSLTIVYSTVYSRRRSKKISKLGVTGLWSGNSPVTGEFPAQRASNAKMFPFDDVMMFPIPQIIPYLVQDLMNYPGTPGLFAAAVLSGTLRYITLNRKELCHSFQCCHNKRHDVSKSPTSRVLTLAQPFVQARIKENIKDSRHWPLWGESSVTGGFRSQKRPVTRKNVSIW